MVDIISNRVQEAYGSFRLPSMFGPGTDTQQNGGFSTYSMLKRFGEAGRRQRELNADIDRQVRQQSLFHIKEMPITHVQPELKPIPGMACPYCSPAESVSLFSEAYLSHTFICLHFSILYACIISGTDHQFLIVCKLTPFKAV
uniref:Uncharacterized protein n=1 Tax=Anopheles maculatus TaxID=74869 RepID=A0A182SAD0_9DIPT